MAVILWYCISLQYVVHPIPSFSFQPETVCTFRRAGSAMVNFAWKPYSVFTYKCMLISIIFRHISIKKEVACAFRIEKLFVLRNWLIPSLVKHRPVQYIPVYTPYLVISLVKIANWSHLSRHKKRVQIEIYYLPPNFASMFFHSERSENIRWKKIWANERKYYIR